MRRLIISLLIAAAVVLAAWVLWLRISNLANESDVTIVETEDVAVVLQPPDSIATAPYEGFLAPDFALRSYVGSQVRLSDSLDRPTIVTFWEGQCLFCLSQLQTLTTLARNNTNATILAINRGDDLADTEHVYGVLDPPSNFILLFDPNDIQFGRFQGVAMPTTFFIDQRGVVITRVDREVSANEVEELLQEL